MLRLACKKVMIASALAVALSACGGASGGADDDLAPVGESSDDITAAARLAGDYDQGQGRFASLSLVRTSVGGKLRNSFTAESVVMCVRAPCPTVPLHGRWFARGATLSLYPEGNPAETYRAKLDGDALTLSDAHGTAIASLTKRLPMPDGVAEALAKYGVEKMRVSIDAAEVEAQGKGAKVPFASAVDSALDLFLTDEAGISGFTSELEPEEADEMGCGGKKNLALAKCVTNSGGSISLMARGESPPDEGSVDEAWIFELSDGQTDYGYYAIVPKNGDDAWIYAFN
jgi:hypothetical protein